MRKAMASLLSLVLLWLSAGSARAYEGGDIVGTVETLQQATNDHGCTTAEMRLCDTVADAARQACGAQAAILNGGDFFHNLQGGEATWDDIRGLFTEDRPLAVAEITGRELLAMLEYGVSHAAVNVSTETLDVEASSFEGFPQVSGISFSYDPTAPVGQRIISAELSDGTLVLPGTTLKLAATEYMLSGGYGYPSTDFQSAGVTLAEAVAGYFDDGMLRNPVMGRITVIGLNDRFALPRGTIFVVSVALIMISFSVTKIRRRSKTREAAL